MQQSRYDRRTILWAGSSGATVWALNACGRAPQAVMSNSPVTSAYLVPSNAKALTPDDPRLTFSSFAAARRSIDGFSPSRFEDGQGLGLVTPCVRLALHTNSPYVAFDATFPNMVDGKKILDSGGAWDPFYADILVDGRVAGSFVGRSGDAADAMRTASLGPLPIATKLIELVWPYEHAMTLTAVRVAANAVVTQAIPPVDLIVCSGDSITQGFAADRPSETYPFLLARYRRQQLVNMGYASRIAIASDGVRDGILNPKLGTYMIGANDFMLHVDQQRTPAQFADELRGYLEGWFSANTQVGAHLYLVSPLYAARAEVGGIGLQAYRDIMKEVYNVYREHFAHHRLSYIDGASLMPCSDTLLIDGLHPTRVGHQIVAARLAVVMAQ